MAGSGAVEAKRPRPALLAIDLIEDFLDKLPLEERGTLIAAVNALVGTVRGQGGLVIWVRQEFRRDLSDAFLDMRRSGTAVAIEGTTGSRLDSALAFASRDPVIVKKRYSAFFGTDLDERLAGHEGAPLIIAGINTHACVRTTAIDAYQRDWEVIVAGECVASYDRPHHEMSLAYMDGKIARILSNEAIDTLLSDTARP